MTADADYGRSFAARSGQPAPPNMDWAGYGAEVRRRLENNLAPPKLEAFVRQATILPMPPMAPEEARAIVRENTVRERNSIDFISPKTCREVIRLRELKIISRREARRMLGLPVRWWRFGR